MAPTRHPGCLRRPAVARNNDASCHSIDAVAPSIQRGRSGLENRPGGRWPTRRCSRACASARRDSRSNTSTSFSTRTITDALPRDVLVTARPEISNLWVSRLAQRESQGKRDAFLGTAACGMYLAASRERLRKRLAKAGTNWSSRRKHRDFKLRRDIPKTRQCVDPRTNSVAHRRHVAVFAHCSRKRRGI